MNRYLLPLIIFVSLMILLAAGLKLDPREIPSPFIGKAAPEFNLPSLHNKNNQIAPADMKGQVWLLNVWASWCVSCREEHPLLLEMAKTHQLSIYGLNYKDNRTDAIRWLQELDNPYHAVAVDFSGDTGIDWGVYGVPETFVIDKQGIIRHKHTGVMKPVDIKQTILPLVEKLKVEEKG